MPNKQKVVRAGPKLTYNRFTIIVTTLSNLALNSSQIMSAVVKVSETKALKMV